MTDHLDGASKARVPARGARRYIHIARGLNWKNALGLLALATLLLAAWLIVASPLLHKTPPPGIRLTDLRAISQLRARFNADVGLPRLILILSPT